MRALSAVTDLSIALASLFDVRAGNAGAIISVFLNLKKVIIRMSIDN